MSQYRRTFISHAHLDNAYCAQLHRALRQRGVDVWIDLSNMQIGHDLTDEINRELQQRSAFVLIVTEHSNASYWVRQELSAFNALMNDRQDRVVDGFERIIIPVGLSGAIPVLLRGNLRIEATGIAIEQVADALARALQATGRLSVAPPAVPPAPVLPGEPAPTPARLGQLGFAARRINGVECLIPPAAAVAGGPFLMGSDKNKDPQAYDDELPAYLIHVEPFEMATYPVTVAEYALYLRANPGVQTPPDFTYRSDAAWAAPEWRGKTVTWVGQQQQRFDHPVVGVSWFNARDYATWLAQVTGQRWRLPTEAEWEKAARGTEGWIYPWGNQWDPKRANTQDGGPRLTTPVGAYASQQDASPYGCHDMMGNVWEWCSSLYQPYPYDTNTCENINNHTNYRVLRGGSWDNVPRSARAACRSGYAPVVLNGLGGFRVAPAGRAG